jgi:hypothetical protein
MAGEGGKDIPSKSVDECNLRSVRAAWKWCISAEEVLLRGPGVADDEQLQKQMSVGSADRIVGGRAS